MRRLATLGVVGVSLLTSACWTSLEVQPVDPKKRKDSAHGIRYSLPRPILQVRRSTSGEVFIEVEYVPDDQRTYAIDTHSFLADHDVEIEVVDGLLKGVKWNADTAAVAKSLVDGAGEVGKKLLEQSEERRKQEEKDRQAQEDKLETAEQLVAQKQEAVDVANAKLHAMRANGAPVEQVRAQLIEVAVKEQELQIARARLAELQAELVGTSTPGDGGEAAVKIADRTAPLAFWEIVSTKGGGVGIRSIALEGAPKPDAPSAPTLKLIPKGGEPLVVPSPQSIREARSALRRLLAQVEAILEFGSEEQIGAVSLRLVDAELALDDAEKPVFHLVSNLKADANGLQASGHWRRSLRIEQVSPTEWRVELPPRLPTGDYEITFLINGEEREVNLRFERPNR
jgi:hypothetical protein